MLRCLHHSQTRALAHGGVGVVCTFQSTQLHDEHFQMNGHDLWSQTIYRNKFVNRLTQQRRVCEWCQCMCRCRCRFASARARVGNAGRGRCGAFTCRWRLLLSRRAWNELGVSMVCWRERAAWGALTELCRNHGSEILRRLLCGLSAGGGGVVPIAPARHVRGCRARGRTEEGRDVPASERSRGAIATAAAAARRRSAAPLRPRSLALARSLTTQPPYRATFPEFILQRLPPQSRAKDAPNPFRWEPAAVGDGGATSLAVNSQRNRSQLSRASDYMSPLRVTEAGPLSLLYTLLELTYCIIQLVK